MMNKKYAEGTSVSIERSQNEIKRNLNRHGATGFLFGEQGEKAAILFELKGRQYRMGVTYPPRGKFQNMQPNQYTRVMNAKQRAENAYEQEKQRLWRGLALLVKAKLEAIESGISTLEMEMQPYTVKLQTNLHIFYGKRGPTDARQGDALHLTVPFRYADNSPRQAQYSTQSKR